MKVNFKPGVEVKLSSTGKIIVELGCGKNPKTKNSIKIDNFDYANIDIVTDLNEGIPLEDGSIDEIHSYHFLEHVDDIGYFMKEINRVLKPGGLCIGSVPHFSNPYFYSDYTHKSFFGLYSFSYFDDKQSIFKRKCPTFYSRNLFKISEIKLIFKSPFYGRFLFKKIIQFFVNLSRYTQEFYEENFVYIFPAYEIQFVLRKV